MSVLIGAARTPTPLPRNRLGGHFVRSVHVVDGEPSHVLELRHEWVEATKRAAPTWYRTHVVIVSLQAGQLDEKTAILQSYDAL